MDQHGRSGEGSAPLSIITFLSDGLVATLDGRAPRCSCRIRVTARRIARGRGLWQEAISDAAPPSQQPSSEVSACCPENAR